MDNDINNTVGIGLRTPHYQDIYDTKPDVGFLEVHPENYVGGGYHRKWLTTLAEQYPISLHAIGLSLGSAEPVPTERLQAFKSLIDDTQPALVSDHISWSGLDGTYVPDLLPLPYTEESLQILCDNIDRTQEYFGRQMLVENPTVYMDIPENCIPETTFLADVAKKTGCGLLLDLNNVYVNSVNQGFDPFEWLAEMDLTAVQEIHLAGHSEIDGMLIDTHTGVVNDMTWKLYDAILQRKSGVATLMEWDTDIPALNVLMSEQKKAVSHRAQVVEAA